MSAPGRWLRLDVSTFESEWLAGLHPEAQHAWTRLLLHTKSQGTGGSVKRLGPVAVERAWGITALRLQEMENAAIEDGALVVRDGHWIVTGWDTYQKPDRTNSLRQKNFREKSITADNGVMPRYPAVIRHATETLTLTELQNTTSKASKATEYPEAFEALWRVHRRGPKVKALAEWKKAVPDRIGNDELTTALRAYVAKEINDRFHGHDLFRWIRDGRWEEYLGEAKRDIRSEYLRLKGVR